jgi:hypothetical protein
LRAKDLLGGGNIIDNILHELANSEFVVVDVTGQNPNVFYELGIAHMCKDVEKVILLAQNIDSIPFDLRPFKHLVYSTSADGLQSLREALRTNIAAVGDSAYRIVVNTNGKGALGKMLMGTDHCLYQFEILDAFSGYGSAKFFLRASRHVMGHEREVTVVYEGGFGLSVGEHGPIPNTDWSICLERIATDRPVFRLERTASPRPNPDNRAASHQSRTRKRPK